MQHSYGRTSTCHDPPLRRTWFKAVARVALVFYLAMLAMASQSGCLPLNQLRPKDQQGPFFEAEEPYMGGVMGPRELQAALMSMADSYAVLMIEAFTTFADTVNTDQARLLAAARKFYGSASAIEIASRPYPGVALLDLLMLITLNRMVWEDYWMKVYGPAAQPVLMAFREQEQRVWELAGRFLNAEQQDELRELLRTWRAEHPNVTRVNYISFSDFGELGLKPSMRKLATPGGVFATVRAATEIAGDIKATMDRAMYLFSRMQALVNNQFELAMLQALNIPQVRKLVNNAENMQGLAARYEKLIAGFPGEMEGLARSVLANSMRQISQERETAITQVMTGLTELQKRTVSEVGAMVREERSQTIQQALLGIESRQNEMTEEAQTLLVSTGSELRKTLTYAALLGLGLIISFFVLLYIYKAAIRRKS